MPSENDKSDPTPTTECWCKGEGFRTEGRNIGGFYEQTKVYCNCHIGRSKLAFAEVALVVSRANAAIGGLEAQQELADVPLRYRSFRLDETPLKGENLHFIRDMQDYEPNSYYIYGSYGVGKTGLAISYLNSFLVNVVKQDQLLKGLKRPKQLAIFRTTPDLLSQLRDCYNSNASEYELIRQMGDVPLLVLDDIGAENCKDKGWLSDRLYQILNRRSSNGFPTVFTSNVDLDKLKETVSERVVERIMEMCGFDRIIEIKGENLRLL